MCCIRSTVDDSVPVKLPSGQIWLVNKVNLQFIVYTSAFVYGFSSIRIQLFIPMRIHSLLSCFRTVLKVELLLTLLFLPQISADPNFLLASWRPLTKKAGSGSVSQLYGSADPDPCQKFTDPQQWWFRFRIRLVPEGDLDPDPTWNKQVYKSKMRGQLSEK